MSTSSGGNKVKNKELIKRATSGPKSECLVPASCSAEPFEVRSRVQLQLQLLTTTSANAMEDVGRFGTVSLLDASTGNAITAFGIDTSPVTFGSDPSCTVRLFYPSISASHAHITFHDLKAFLVVSGPSGIEVDGCKVYPPSTIPLPNRTEFKLAGKRFMFSYPPKEMRSVDREPCQTESR